MLPPLGVKSEQQQPQQQQQTPLYGQQGPRKFKLNRSFKQTIRMPLPTSSSILRPISKTSNYATSQFCFTIAISIQQPYSFANGMTNMAQFHPQTLTSHSDFDQQQMQQSTQPSQHKAGADTTTIKSEPVLAEQKRGRRFRRRFNQIERKYPCSFPGCQKSYGSLNHLNTHIVTKSMVTENQKLISNILFNQRRNKPSEISQYVQPSNDYTAGNYWYGYALICDQPLRQHPRKVIRSFRQIPQPQQQQQQQPQQQNNSNNYLYHQGFQQPITNATTVMGQRQLLLHLRPLELRLHLFCTNLKFRIPHLPHSASAKNGNGQYGLLSATRGPQYFPAPQQSLRNQ